MNMKKTIDIKRIMQEQIRGTKVNSPYAKYNSRGQLFCIICGSSVKSSIIWQAHINKKSHKENLIKLQEKQQKVNALPSTLSKQQINNNGSTNMKNSIKDKPKGILKNFANYSSSEDSDDEEVSQLPIGDHINDKEIPNDSSDKEKFNEQRGNCSTKGASALPEGFFDDPVADAKARKVEYKDKEEEEWQEFMKEVSAAEVESRQIIAEDKQESAIEIQLEQATDQIKYLERVVEIDKKKKAKLKDKTEDIKVEMEYSSDEEFIPVIWRTKNSLI